MGAMRKLRNLQKKNREQKLNKLGYVKASGPQEVSVHAPQAEKEVINKVPAHWGEELIGETFIYEDGTFDMVLNTDVSPDILKALEATMGYKANMYSGDLSALEGDEDGSAEQDG